MRLEDAFLNPVISRILDVALSVYAWLIHLMMHMPRDEDWRKNAAADLSSLRILVGVLPLLGLLGTIIGLLEVFHQMTVDRGLDPATLISGGNGDAMFTTQVGLLMVIPGWLALSYLQAKINESESS